MEARDHGQSVLGLSTLCGLHGRPNHSRSLTFGSRVANRNCNLPPRNG